MTQNDWIRAYIPDEVEITVCPNCGNELIDSLCNCGHDGARKDCPCEFCNSEPTADLVVFP